MTKETRIEQPEEQEKDEDKIYGTIYEAIMTQQLSPGFKLGEDSLAEIFKVSRARIRRVLLRLSYSRVVNLEPNRGAFVASPSLQEAKEVFEARRIIEAAIVHTVTRTIAPDQIALLEDIIASEQIACEQGDRPTAIKLAGQFHLLLADMAGNRILKELLQNLVSQTSLIVTLYEVSGFHRCTENGHRQLIQAIASGAPEQAEQAMTQHLIEVEMSLNLNRSLNLPVRLQDILKSHRA
ncbi:MAG: GntR family transcriptional regulator [Oculatellaceae cyanobacterium Prado106]|jgi:DNA-binding GntR family transcriptional regulator|nr:GntR family transcriptional regulator [Oculatellaceae cyanobacterium Prado106]